MFANSSDRHMEATTVPSQVRASAGALLCPHHSLLLICNGQAHTAEQTVEVTPAVRGQAAVQTGHSVQFPLLLPGRLKELLLRGAKPLQALPEKQGGQHEDSKVARKVHNETFQYRALPGSRTESVEDSACIKMPLGTSMESYPGKLIKMPGLGCKWHPPMGV